MVSLWLWRMRASITPGRSMFTQYSVYILFPEAGRQPLVTIIQLTSNAMRYGIQTQMGQ